MPYSPSALVVDDERVVAETLTLVLKKAGYRAISCYSAAEALSLISAQLFDIVLCDVVLGEFSGIDVAIAARKLLPNCRVILISGNFATQELLDKAKLGGHHFTCLPKPIPPDELLAQLATEAREQSASQPQPEADAD